MGKQRRQRQKLHIPASNAKKADSTTELVMDTAPPIDAAEDVFKGLNISFDKLNTTLPEDVQSVRSYKSVKSEMSSNKLLSKKDKLKLRKDILLKKIDAVNQLKKEYKARNKRRKTAIIGDTNPLRDALPSLESLLKSSTEINQKQRPVPKQKAIQKATKRKKTLIKEVELFKKILADKNFKNNPMAAISEHVKAVVENEKLVKAPAKR